ncbi:MAG: hypothetical protein KDD60_08565 [Bdellovibrionales bacterium]|nr:hypothetical protein [Bdellovibrionales bacterium]
MNSWKTQFSKGKTSLLVAFLLLGLFSVGGCKKLTKEYANTGSVKSGPDYTVELNQNLSPAGSYAQEGSEHRKPSN